MQVDGKGAAFEYIFADGKRSLHVMQRSSDASDLSVIRALQSLKGEPKQSGSPLNKRRMLCTARQLSARRLEIDALVDDDPLCSPLSPTGQIRDANELLLLDSEFLQILEEIASEGEFKHYEIIHRAVMEAPWLDAYLKYFIRAWKAKHGPCARSSKDDLGVDATSRTIASDKQANSKSRYKNDWLWDVLPLVLPWLRVHEIARMMSASRQSHQRIQEDLKSISFEPLQAVFDDEKVKSSVPAASSSSLHLGD